MCTFLQNVRTLTSENANRSSSCLSSGYARLKTSSSSRWKDANVSHMSRLRSASSHVGIRGPGERALECRVHELNEVRVSATTSCSGLEQTP